MSTGASWLERARARVRSAEAGRDDSHGVTADAVSPPPGPAIQGPSAPPLATSLGVPGALVVVAGWSGCLLLIGLLGWQMLALLARFGEVTVPLAISLLVSAIASPGVDLLERIGVRRWLGSLIVVLGGLVVVGGLFTLIGRQAAGQFDELSEEVAAGLLRVQEWLRGGPIGVSDAQVQDYVDKQVRALQNADAQVLREAVAVGATVGQAVAGLFIVAFATYFFCAQGASIWHWLVGLVPGSARERVDSSGRVAWVSLTAFVRATVLVAFADAVGIGLGALLLGVPLALAIAVLVFLTAFVPIIGATVSGAVAVLVALVAQGPVVAGLMLAVVVAVQQVEMHLLQPFLMGRFVAVHPLVIIAALTVGLVAAGIAGALIAVPLVACANAVVKHLRGDPAPAEP